MLLSEDDADRAHRRLQRLRAFRSGAAQLVAALQAFLHSCTSGDTFAVTASTWVTEGRRLAIGCPCCWESQARSSCIKLGYSWPDPSSCKVRSFPWPVAGPEWMQLLAKLMVSSEQVAATVLSRGPSATLAGVLSRMSSLAGPGE